MCARISARGEASYTFFPCSRQYQQSPASLSPSTLSCTPQKALKSNPKAHCEAGCLVVQKLRTLPKDRAGHGSGGGWLDLVALVYFSYAQER